MKLDSYRRITRSYFFLNPQTTSKHIICTFSLVVLVFFCHKLDQRKHYLLHSYSSGMCPKKRN